MGNSKSKTTNKYNKLNNKYKTTNNSIKNNEIDKLKLSETYQIFDAIITAYTQKKSNSELNVLYMQRKNKIHISIQLSCGLIKDMAETEQTAIIDLLTDYFINMGINHEIYINDYLDELGYYKLYCHIG